MNDDDYLLWLLDNTRNPFRIMLIEAEHQSGLVRIGSQPWISNANYSYDDWLISKPHMESILNSISGIGEFTAINLDHSKNNWSRNVWYGNECRWYYGDTSWPVKDFRTIGRSLIEKVKALGNNRFQFELMDYGHKLNSSLINEDDTRTETVEDALEWITQTTDTTVALVHIDESKLAWDISYDVSPTTTAIDLLKQIAKSINVDIAVDQFGNFEFISYFAENALMFNTDVISGDNKITVSDIIPAYTNVTVIKSDGTRVDGTSQLTQGYLTKELDIATFLTDDYQASVLLGEYLKYHANPHYVWEVPITIGLDLVKIGSVATIIHPELTETGIINRITRSPLSNRSSIEIKT